MTVNQIAQSQSLTSPAFDATAALGTGSMSLTVNGKTSTINLDSTNNTLSGIASTINNASDNPGVTASIVTGSDGAHLVLRANNSGAANTITVAVNASTDNGLSNLAVSSTPNTTGGQSTITAGSTTATQWTQSSTAQDASVTVNGVTNLSASNAVTNVITGVTLNLTQAAVTNPATTQTVTIAVDTTKQATAVTNFVSNYNTLVQAMTTVGSFDNTDPTAPVTGPLFGDSTLNTIRTQMQTILGSAVNSNGVGATLQQLGITVADGTTAGQTAGTLIVDQTALTTALTNNPTAASTLFNSTNGLGEQINAAITSYTSDKGILTLSANAVQTDLNSLTAQQTTLSAYAATLTTQYNTQFTQLNTVMAEMTQQQNYLTALFGGTNSAGALATNKSCEPRPPPGEPDMGQHILVSQLLSMPHEIDRAVRLADWEGAERLIGARALPAVARGDADAGGSADDPRNPGARRRHRGRNGPRQRRAATRIPDRLGTGGVPFVVEGWDGGVS
ncbi:MAG: B-type flagellar hook-associated protein 2 [Burkholderia gladioli]|nr:MAG: B-type flagellar hook-associated protein 2 [Burkholderia gladioli]